LNLSTQAYTRGRDSRYQTGMKGTAPYSLPGHFTRTSVPNACCQNTRCRPRGRAEAALRPRSGGRHRDGIRPGRHTEVSVSLRRCKFYTEDCLPQPPPYSFKEPVHTTALAAGRWMTWKSCRQRITDVLAVKTKNLCLLERHARSWRDCVGPGRLRRLSPPSQACGSGWSTAQEW